MPYEIKIDKPALKFIKKQPSHMQERIFKAIKMLPDGDVKALKGASGYYRLRVGSYRIIYTIDNGQCVVCVVAAGNRGQIYNRY